MYHYALGKNININQRLWEYFSQLITYEFIMAPNGFVSCSRRSCLFKVLLRCYIMCLLGIPFNLTTQGKASELNQVNHAPDPGTLQDLTLKYWNSIFLSILSSFTLMAKEAFIFSLFFSFLLKFKKISSFLEIVYLSELIMEVVYRFLSPLPKKRKNGFSPSIWSFPCKHVKIVSGLITVFWISGPASIHRSLSLSFPDHTVTKDWRPQILCFRILAMFFIYFTPSILHSNSKAMYLH